MTFFERIKAFTEDFFCRNSIILKDKNRKILKNHVNLHWWSIGKDKENLGDYLSIIVVDYMKKYYGIDDHMPIKKTKHLYAIGSIIDAGLQDAVIWGSGYLNDKIDNFYFRMFYKIRKLDVRCVRGPETRRILETVNIKCPEIFGDPALLMPYIYQPKKQKTITKYSVVKHWSDEQPAENCITITTRDYKRFIDAVVASELIISSSLHGIILAEVYGVPAVLYIPAECSGYIDEFKYRDYYYSTGRYEFPIANSIEEALNTEPCELPDVKQLQKNLIKTFPVDLWR